MSFFDTPIEFLKGVGPQRAMMLQKELRIFTFGDLIQHYPFRYEDRTCFHSISKVTENMSYVQVKGKISNLKLIGDRFKRRLVAVITDSTGDMELVWFQGINGITQLVKTNSEYIVFGKITRYGNHLSMAHPDISLLSPGSEPQGYLQPVYPLSEKLRSRYIDTKFIIRIQQEVLKGAIPHLKETLPNSVLQSFKLLNKRDSMGYIHFPKNQKELQAAQKRLKFEELFFMQLRLLKMKLVRQDKYKGMVFSDTSLLTKFYKEHLPFELTEAQKKVIREIYTDMKSGKQMSRLLQGDVGSGKTIVGFISMLLAITGNTQVALMAPTEILAQQHFNNLKKYATDMNISIALLTGSVKKKNRKPIHQQLADGELKILIGTHALLEEEVKFNKLGLAIIDEQHRFGVAQRSKIWKKNTDIFPHILIMTATPIPRTLAMTLYGDLDISVMDMLPTGRKPIKTIHRVDSHRLQVNAFIQEQLQVGRQVYVVYPLIEETEKMDLKDLMDGYESLTRAFPHVPISILHGQMNAEAKDFEMGRFIKNETKIMVATTVIEVGVDVPNATVMIIESAHRFGLSQLHQLRGRVGRSSEQSYCILMTDYQLSAESKMRIQTMVQTNNGFKIAEADLKLRGPGDLMGTQQSGVLDLLIADLGKDGELLQQARTCARSILEKDPLLTHPENAVIAQQIQSIKKNMISWSRIS